MFTSLKMVGSLGIVLVLVLGGCVKEHQGGLELDDDDVSSDDDEATNTSGDAEVQQNDSGPSADDDMVTADDDVTMDDDADDDVAAMDDDETDDDIAPESDDDAMAPDDHEHLDASTTSPVPDETPSPSDAGATPETPEPDTSPVGDAGWIDDEACLYHSPPVPFSPLPPDAGPDAGHPPAPQLTIAESPFVGNYLADGAGYALYIYTADLPGDCDTPPVSTCFDDCLLAWPLFEAGDRVLPEGLDDHAIGTFARADGIAQTTYYGWPLYYYKRDEAPGDTLGQGKGQVWYLAELEMPNVVIMRAPEELEGIKYLADGRGRTLYTHGGDVPGTTTAPPRSECTGACRASFRPFNVRSLRPVTDLEPGLFTVFIDSASGGQQVSFRGLPLYLSNDDATSGSMNGLTQDGFSVVLP